MLFIMDSLEIGEVSVIREAERVCNIEDDPACLHSNGYGQV